MKELFFFKKKSQAAPSKPVSKRGCVTLDHGRSNVLCNSYPSGSLCSLDSSGTNFSQNCVRLGFFFCSFEGLRRPVLQDNCIKHNGTRDGRDTCYSNPRLCIKAHPDGVCLCVCVCECAGEDLFVKLITHRIIES